MKQEEMDIENYINYEVAAQQTMMRQRTLKPLGQLQIQMPPPIIIPAYKQHKNYLLKTRSKRTNSFVKCSPYRALKYHQIACDPQILGLSFSQLAFLFAWHLSIIEPLRFLN